jgi:CRISPR-associated protein Cas1
MNFRVIYISHICKLFYRNNNLVVKNENGDTSIPLSDISVILIENLAVSITSKLLSSLSENKITTMICDESHLPNGILLPFNGKVRMLESYKYQQNISLSLKNKLWDKIIKNKIYNSACILKYSHLDNASILLKMINEVNNGDSINIEAQTAQIYWKSIFIENFTYFTRGLLDIRNSALNYGYAILRSIIANNLASKGFILYDGLHHHSELNQFNLVDDIIEPFRSFVDLEVYEIFESEECYELELNSEIKKRLLGIVDSTAYINNQKFSLINAIGKYCDNLYNCYKDNTDIHLIDVYVDIWN